MKKLILSLFILFLSFFGIKNVNASGTGIVKTDGASYEVAAFADFADNTNGHLTRVNATFVENGHYFRSNQSLLTNGSDRDGVNLLFDSNTSFVAGYTYLVSILVSMRDTYAKPSSTRVCIAETLTNVTTRFNNPSGFPCVNATVTATNGTALFSDGNISLYYSVLNYIFTADATGNSITMSYNTVGSIESNHTFGGYKVILLSDNRQLTQQQITSAVQNSGLATAQSVTQVQQSISQVKQEIKAMEQQQQQTNEKLDDLNNNITNDNVSGIEDAFSSFDGFISENSTITQLITMPITLFSSILTGVQSTCQPFSLGNLFGTNLTLPCINIGNYLGAALWTMIDVIISGFTIFAISKKLIKIFNNFSSMKEGDVIDD